MKEIDSISAKNPRLYVIALPTNRADRYSSVKKRCLVDLGIPCQVIVKNKTMNHRNLNSIATKVAIQINCKLGGIPWMIKLPIKGLMTVGFDVSHHPRDRARSIGALVSTMDLTSESPVFFSVTMEYRDGNEMVEGLDRYLRAALEKFIKVHQALPERIVFYRDGVGEGQIETVNAKEVQPIIRTLEDVYKEKPQRFAYIIVNKHSNARFFKPSGEKSFVNPPPGTVIDNVITMGDRNDFYLISQHVGQGTVAPTYYQIIHNSSELNTDKLQILTYKMCHLYYNWGEF
jgi:aubergine